jgi:hypothetical protein
MRITLLLALCLCGPISNGTSIAVVVGPREIVMAADGKTMESGVGRIGPPTGRVSPKIMLFKRIAISSYNVAKIGPDPNPFYFLGDVFDSLKRKITNESSVSDAADAVAQQLTQASKGIHAALVTHAITKEGMIQVSGHENPLVGFVVSGYENGQAKVFNITIEIDWDSLDLIPVKPKLLYPDSNQPDTHMFYSDLEKGPAALEWTKCRVPETVPPVTDAELVARALVDFAIETNEDNVGLPIKTIILYPRRKPVRHTFDLRMPVLCATKKD